MHRRDLEPAQDDLDASGHKSSPSQGGHQTAAVCRMRAASPRRCAERSSCARGAVGAAEAGGSSFRRRSWGAAGAQRRAVSLLCAALQPPLQGIAKARGVFGRQGQPRGQ